MPFFKAALRCHYNVQTSMVEDSRVWIAYLAAMIGMAVHKIVKLSATSLNHKSVYLHR